MPARAVRGGRGRNGQASIACDEEGTLDVMRFGHKDSGVPAVIAHEGTAVLDVLDGVTSLLFKCDSARRHAIRPQDASHSGSFARRRAGETAGRDNVSGQAPMIK